MESQHKEDYKHNTQNGEDDDTNDKVHSCVRSLKVVRLEGDGGGDVE